MIYDDISKISEESYKSCPKAGKHVDKAVKYYVLMKEKIDYERFQEQPSHSRINITDASDNIAQSYFRDWVWFDEVYVGHGVTNRNCIEGDLESFIRDEIDGQKE